MVIPAVDTSSWSRIKALCASHTGLHPAYGLHPVFLPQHAPTDVDALSSWLNENRPVAVGEIGLDFHLDALDRDLQRHYFTRHTHLDREHALPVIVHAHGAQGES